MSGLLGKQLLASDPESKAWLYTVPPGKCATANLLLCNSSTAMRTVYVAISTGSWDVQDHIEFASPIPPHGILERTGLVLSPGEKIGGWADGEGISARVHGFEENE